MTFVSTTTRKGSSPSDKSLRDWTGQKFGRWTAQYLLEKRLARRTRWWCICDCGSQKAVLTCHLVSGKSVSCGCYKNETASVSHLKHGCAKRIAGKKDDSEYRIWCLMKGRCNSPTHPDFRIYGARGITVCPEWQADFTNFLADMGRRPTSLHSIDRIDSNGNYEPGNCRWATKKEQANNTSRNRYVEVCGQRMTLREAVDRFGGKYDTVKWRLYQGQPIEKALRLA